MRARNIESVWQTIRIEVCVDEIHQSLFPKLMNVIFVIEVTIIGGAAWLIAAVVQRALSIPLFLGFPISLLLLLLVVWRINRKARENPYPLCENGKCERDDYMWLSLTKGGFILECHCGNRYLYSPRDDTFKIIKGPGQYLKFRRKKRGEWIPDV
jgi:hypothetical protein